MKITSITAAVFSNDPTSIVNSYEETLGLQVRHMTVFGEALAPLSAMFSLGNDKGARFDVIQINGEETTGVRVNADHFEDAFAAYEQLGYKTVCGPAIAESAMTALLTKEGCIPVLLVQHVQK